MERNKTSGKENKIANFIIHSLLYFALSISFYTKFQVFEYQESHLLWPVFWLKFFDGALIIGLLKVALLFGPFLTLHSSTRKWGQVFTSLAAFFLLSISYSNGKSYHSGLSWIYFLTLFSIAKLFTSPRQAAHFALFCVCTAYFNSGLWKLKSILPYIFETFDFSIVKDVLREHVAYAAIERMKQPTYLGTLIINNSLVSGTLWSFAIICELSVILVAFSRKYTFLFPLMLLLFHLGTLLILRINFMPSIVLFATLSVYFYLVRNDFNLKPFTD